MSGSLDQLYRDARVGLLGADRMAAGLPCIPHQDIGDLVEVQKLNADLAAKDAEIKRLEAALAEAIQDKESWQKTAVVLGTLRDQMMAERDAALPIEYAAREWAAGRYSDEQLREQLAEEE